MFSCLSSIPLYAFVLHIPLEISPFSLRPPQSESVTSGKSIAESDMHSVPLSAAALPTDWGDWEPERVSDSVHCLKPGSESLKESEKYFTLKKNVQILGYRPHYTITPPKKNILLLHFYIISQHKFKTNLTKNPDTHTNPS